MLTQLRTRSMQAALRLTASCSSKIAASIVARAFITSNKAPVVSSSSSAPSRSLEGVFSRGLYNSSNKCVNTTHRALVPHYSAFVLGIYQQQRHHRPGNLQHQEEGTVLSTAVPDNTGMASVQEGHKLQGKGAAELSEHAHEPLLTAEDPAEELMAEAYGEGYSTRSSEEGFGGIYAPPVSGDEDDDTPPLKAIDPAIARSAPPASSPDFDRSQGSTVAEKEKTRHGQGVVGGHA